MSDLISRQAAIEAVHKSIFDFFDICDDDEESPMTYKDELLLELNKAITTQIKAVASAQPIEAEPIKHGRWIKNEGRSGWHCSCCGKDDLYAYPYTENNERELQDFYCPNCGARMDGEENG